MCESPLAEFFKTRYKDEQVRCASNRELYIYNWYSAQTRTGIGLLGKPPAEKQFPSVESLLCSPAQTQV
jgi:hypothetical protein